MEHDDSSQPIEEFLDELTNEKPKLFSPDELMRFTTNLEKKVGAGGFGDVYKGEFPNGVKIAVKVLKDNNNTKEIMRKQFEAEVGTMGKTSHRNLIKLYGYCFDTNMKALVYEYVENGSFDKILFKNHLNLEWEKLYEIAIQIANGLSFLHEHCEPPIIHYDVKPDNVLIDPNLSPKIIDFGMARNSRQLEQSGYRGTYGYVAPEVGRGKIVTYKSDIYSFGMMLFEILRKKKNSEGPGWFPGEVAERVHKDELEEIILMCGIEEKNKAKAEKLCIVALWCTQEKIQHRRDMSSVVKMLQGEIPLEKPPNPFGFHDSSPESSMYGGRALPKYSPAFTEGLLEENSRERAGDSTPKESGSSFASRPPSKSNPIDLKRESVKIHSGNTHLEPNASSEKEHSEHSSPESSMVGGGALPKLSPTPTEFQAMQLANPITVIGVQYCAPVPVNFTVIRKVRTINNGNLAVADGNGNIIFRVRVCRSIFNLHSQHVLLLDAKGNPLVTLRQTIVSAHKRWKVYRGDSSDDKDHLFSVKQSSMIQLRNQQEAFLASNTSEEVCDFKIRGSWFARSCVVYLGDSSNIIAQMHKNHSAEGVVQGKDTSMVTVYPYVDCTFIVALLVTLNEAETT